MMFRRTIEPTAGAVVYNSAIKINVQPADMRASDTLGMVKSG